MIFNDSVDNNIETLRELLRSLPQSARGRARSAGMAITNTFEQLRRDNPRDPATALGAAYAIFYLAEHLVEQDRDDPDHQIIQLVR